MLRQWLFRSSIQLFVRQVGVQELCLSEGSDVREVVDLHSRGKCYRACLFLETAHGTPLPSMYCNALFVTANVFKTHQFHHIGDVTL